MRRHAKASSAGSNLDQGSRPGSIRRAFATRGASFGVEGSGAPSGGRRNTATILAGLVALLTLVVGVSIAIAAKKVDSYAGSSTGATGSTAGLLSTPRGIAVNQNGTGGAQAGDFYVVDGSNNRISQFRANNTFVRAFGLDVVSSGPDQASEVQWVTVNATEGTFKLTFGANTTTDLPFNATAGEVQTALNALASINSGGGSVAVSGGPGDGTGSSPYVVAFNGAALKGTNVAQMTAASGATPLGSGSGFGANEAKVTTANSGATGYEICDALANPTDVCKAGVTTGGLGGTLSAPQGVAIDQATGNVYVTDSSNRRIQRFSATGTWQRAFGWDTITNGAATGDASNVATFQICTVMQNCKVGVAGANAGQFSSSTAGNPATDAAGNLYVPDVNQRRVEKFDSNGNFVSAWGWDVIPSTKPGDVGTELEACPATAANTSGDCQAGTQGSGLGQFGSSSPTRVAVDSTGKVYVIDTGNSRLLSFNSSGAGPATFYTSPSGSIAPTDVAIGPANNVFVVVPCPSGAPALEEACPGAAAGSERWIKELSPAGALQDTHMVGRAFTSVNGLAANPGNDRVYFSTSSGTPGSRVWTIDNDGAAPPPAVTINAPTEITEHTAKFSGTVNPNGPTNLPTSYHFEYSKNGVTWTQVVADVNLGDGTSPISVPVAAVEGSVTGLQANTFYRVRIVAGKAFGAASTISAEIAFLTDAVGPEVQTFYPQAHTDTTATLLGQINPNNLLTTYRFEYGKTASYGSSAPVPDASTTGGTNAKIIQDIAGLEADTTYHYRLVASNAEGTTNGADVIFTTRATSAAQESRGYEMVTPPFKIVRSNGSSGGYPRNNVNPAYPSLDGDTVVWSVPFFPLTDDVASPLAGDERIVRRTPDGWVNSTLNTLPESTEVEAAQPSVLLKPSPDASSGDFETITWVNRDGVPRGGGLLPTEGVLANRLYTRRTGTGTSGFTPWLTNPVQQLGDVGFEVFAAASNIVTNTSGNEDRAVLNDDGSALARWGYYRGLADGPSDDTADPSDDQQLPGRAGGATIYAQRVADPDDLPAAPKDLVNECTGSIAGGPAPSAVATQIPARIGTGLTTDTIGTQPCTQPASPDATGTGTRTDGSAVITGVATSTGAFAVGQLVSGPGIPGGATIVAVGPGTLTLSALASNLAVNGTARHEAGSPAFTVAYSMHGAFAVGQTVTGPGIPPGTTILAIDNELLTLSANATTSTFGASEPVSVVAPPVVTPLSATAVQSVTSKRGATVGGGKGLDSQPTSGTPATAMSDDGRRIFFQSPDYRASGLPTASCSAGTGTSSDCVPQLFVRQYDDDGDPIVRWVSRSRSNPVGSGGYDGPIVPGQQYREMGAGASFQGASRDGRVVYFKTNAPLTPDDPNGGASITAGIAQDTSWDLYRYILPASLDADPDAGVLTRISGGPSGLADPSTNKASGGDAALRFHSDDGSRAYFLTMSPIVGADSTAPNGGATTPGGTVAEGSVRNLYLFDSNETGVDRYKFIARIPYSTANSGPASFNRCATAGSGTYQHLSISAKRFYSNVLGGNCFRGTPDGSAVLFPSAARLTVDDDDDASDIYLYNADTDELTRVTAPPPGVAPFACIGNDFIPTGTCNGDLGRGVNTGGFNGPLGACCRGEWETARGWSGMRSYNISKDAGVVSVYFESQLQLVPEDTNGDYMDVYQWRNGKLSLVSPGTTPHDSWFSGNSVDGRDVFLFTGAPIDPREIDSQDLDIYDARIGGGFPYTPPAVPCDVLAHACRPSALAAPSASTAASTGMSGGNVLRTPATKKRKCGKGKARRKGRCVKEGRVKRTAGKTGRAGR